MAKKRTAKRKKQNHKKNALIKRLPFLRFFISRFGVLSLCAVALIALGSWFFLSGAHQDVLRWVHRQTLQITSDIGFKVENVIIADTKRSDPRTIIALLNIRSGDPLFSVSPHAARLQVEKLEWVRKARVERRLSGDVLVSVTEYEPIALWHDGENFQVVSAQGTLVTEAQPGSFGALMVLYGDDAYKQAPAFFEVLDDFPDIKAFVRGARFVGKRRWDLIHKNGMIIKLPEDAYKSSLGRLLEAHKKDNLLNKDLKSVDLRNEERVIIRAKPGDARSQSTE